MSRWAGASCVKMLRAKVLDSFFCSSNAKVKTLTCALQVAAFGPSWPAESVFHASSSSA
jgi:hypothetical protein